MLRFQSDRGIDSKNDLEAEIRILWWMVTSLTSLCAIPAIYSVSRWRPGLKVQAEVSMCWIKDYRPRRITTKPNIAHLALILI